MAGGRIARELGVGIAGGLHSGLTSEAIIETNGPVTLDAEILESTASAQIGKPLMWPARQTGESCAVDIPLVIRGLGGSGIPPYLARFLRAGGMQESGSGYGITWALPLGAGCARRATATP